MARVLLTQPVTGKPFEFDEASVEFWEARGYGLPQDRLDDESADATDEKQDEATDDESATKSTSGKKNSPLATTKPKNSVVEDK